MKYIAPALISSLLCLAPASLYAQTGAKKPDSGRLQFHIGILSGATVIGGQIGDNNVVTRFADNSDPLDALSRGAPTRTRDAGNNRKRAPLAGGILGWRYNTNPNIALGADFYVGWTDTAFFKYVSSPPPGSFSAGVFSLDPRPTGDLVSVTETFAYDVKSALNFRLYWDLPIQGKPLSVFLLSGYQLRRVLITTETNTSTDGFSIQKVERKTRSEIEHGYQIGFGGDYALVPAHSNIKLRLEYLFAQNFGKDARELSTHDIMVGAIYNF